MRADGEDFTAESLGVLTFSRLSSVEFVQDYVQLRFGGPCLTAITHPLVEREGKTYTWDGCGYRDALCACIAKTVIGSSVRPEWELTLDFDDGARVMVSLRPEDLSGRSAEAATFDNGAGDFWVW